MKEISHLLRKQNIEFEVGASSFWNLYCFASTQFSPHKTKKRISFIKLFSQNNNCNFLSKYVCWKKWNLWVFMDNEAQQI